MSADGDLFNQLIQNPYPPTNKPPTNQYQALQALNLSSGPSNALTQGNVLLKIECRDEIRCRSVSEDYGWDDLQYMVQQMFIGHISPRDPMSLRFKDPDGDWVTMGGEDEFNLAKQLTPKLYISVSQNHTDRRTAHIPQLRSELVRMRDEINRVLELIPLGAGEVYPVTKVDPTPPQSVESKKVLREEVSAVPPMQELKEETRALSPHMSANQTPQYSNLGQLPTAILPAPPVQEVYGFDHQPQGVAPSFQPPNSVPAQATAPSLGSASSLFHSHALPFPVPSSSAPYPQTYGQPLQSAPVYNQQFYPYYTAPK